MSTILSIVIPVYNVEKYLERCLRSVLDQRTENLEIILVDDGSTDSSPEICDAYAGRYSCVKVLHKKNSGLSDARNVGIAAACGEYVLFLDSDDYIGSGCLKELAPFFSAGYDIIVTDGMCEGKVQLLSHAFECPVCTGKEFLLIALRHRQMPMAACLYSYRRAFLLENQLQFQKGILHEDEEFTPRAFLAANKVVNTHVCCYHYVIRGNSITTRKDMRKNAEDFHATCKKLAAVYSCLLDSELQDLLTDSLAEKTLSLFQQGKLYQACQPHHEKTDRNQKEIIYL